MQICRDESIQTYRYIKRQRYRATYISIFRYTETLRYT